MATPTSTTIKTPPKISQRKCILNCNNVTHTHGFPKDGIGRGVWLKQLGLKHVHKTAAVCDRHFSPKMRPSFNSTRISSWAVPDINLPPKKSEDNDEYYSDDNMDDDDMDDISNDGGPPYSGKVNGISRYDKNKGNDTLDADFIGNNNLNESDPLDFENMVTKQNNNKLTAEFVEDSEFEELFDDDEDYDDPEPGGDTEAETMVEDVDEVNFSDKAVSTNDINEISEEETASARAKSLEINSKIKRKLIASVRRRRILYDPAHPYFGDIEKKTRAWERIGKIQNMEGSACQQLWFNIRYDYQNYVRSLRRWLAGECNQRGRPRIQFENDLIFLWRHISDYPSEEIDVTQPSNNASNSPGASHDKNSAVHSYANKENKEEKANNFVANLIDAVEPYSEIYDTMNPNYGDAKRRSTIWDAISNELKEKATKCLYSWIQLQFRYELEMTHNCYTYLVMKMKFLRKHILLNEKSPFKRSTCLRVQWVDPFTSSEDQHMLLATMISCKKTRPYFANIDCPFATIDLLKVPWWQAVAKARKCKPAKCEVTWIIMQMMYCELAEFRRKKCPLRDVWEFESIITNLRDGAVKPKSKKYPKLDDIPAPKELSRPNKTDNSSASTEQYDVEMIIPALDASMHPPSPTPSTPPPATPPPPISSPPPPISPPAHNQPATKSSTQPPPSPPKNEITFQIPSNNPEHDLKSVRYVLDTPLTELPELSVVDVGSVVENAHIVILSRHRLIPKVYVFTLEKRQELIAEVMARPVIFNEPCKTSKVSKLFLSEISKDFGYPVEVCTFFWNFIVEKSYFVDYDPDWKKSKESKWIPAPYPIFDKFVKYAEMKNWNDNVAVIADFIQEIGNFPLIYSDLKINSSWNRRQCHIRDISEAWTILARKFGVLENHKLIWDKVKQVFLLYMSEMELSMYNAWPPFWAPVFEKLIFLFEFKYDAKDPIYYVIRLKIQEEILQNKLNTGATLEQLDPTSNAKVIFRLLKENEYLEDFTWVNRARFIAKMKSFPMLYDISHPLFGNREAKLDAWQEMALLFHCTAGECHLIFQHLMKSYLIFRARDANQMCRVNAKYWENMTYIYSCAVPNAVDASTIRARSFRTSSNGSTIKLAEEYQAEISLVDAKPRLILKNIASAVNSLPTQLQHSVTQHIKYIFTEYTRIQNEDIVVDV